MRTEAFYADTTYGYVRPVEPDPGEQVRLFFRTPAEEPVRVSLIVTGGIGEAAEGPCALHMKEVSRDTHFAVYSCALDAGDEPLTYHFKADDGISPVYYGRLGVSAQEENAADFRIYPGFHTPDWAKGAVGYQILVDRFRNGDLNNDVTNGEYIYLGQPCEAQHNWNHLPKDGDYRDFYGGDLLGVMNKLDYLQDLGVEVVYFNPLFVSPSSHKYDTQDYDHIDPHIGTIVDDIKDIENGEYREVYHSMKNMKVTERYIRRTTSTANLTTSDMLFAALVGEMHARGMRVIIDGVFNHCGSFNRWMDCAQMYDGSGAYWSADSPYRDHFIFNDTGDDAWPCNDSYIGWWSNDTLPKLNYASQTLRDEILRIAAKWVSPPYSVDGWRLDVAADLGMNPEMNHAFWRDFRDVVKKANPDALIIAEHYGDPKDYLKGSEWDSVMNYDAFMEPVSWFFTGMEKHSDSARPDLCGNGPAFRDMLMNGNLAFTEASLSVAMNELSNHDHSRFLTRTNRRVGRLNTAGPAAASDAVTKRMMRQGVLFQMTWPGMPTVYYADEAGQTGWTDPDNRRAYPWGHEDKKLINWHRQLIAIRRASNALKHGSTLVTGAGDGWFSFARFTGDERYIAAFNVLKEAVTVELPVWLTGAPDDAKWSCAIHTMRNSAGPGWPVIPEHEGASDTPKEAAGGRLTVTIPARGALLITS